MTVVPAQSASDRGPRRTPIGRAALVTLLLACSARADWSIDPALNNVVTSADGYQSQVRAVPDGASGVLLVWRDTRALTPGLYAQHLDVSGTRLWPAAGALVAAVDPATVQEYTLRAVPGGGLDVAWVRPVVPGTEVRVQRLNASGARTWSDSGSQVTAGLGGCGSVSLLGDGAGGTIVTWGDSRNGLDASDVYVQRFSAVGVAQWTAGGVLLSPAIGYEGGPTAREDGAGGALVVWSRSQTTIRGLVAQRVDGTGNRLWGDGRVVCCPSPQDGQSLALAADGAATGLVFSILQGGVFHLRAQRVDAEALPQWGASGVPVFDVPESFAVAAYPDGSGGLLVLATQVEASAAVRVQRLLADGSRAWGTDGIVIATAAGSFPRTSAVPDGSGGLIVIWPATGPGDVDLRAQRVSAGGTPQWGAGVALATASGDQSQPAAVASGPGGAIVTWSDRRPVTHDDLYASRLNSDGTLPVELQSLTIE